jgi:hypothetical protein
MAEYNELSTGRIQVFIDLWRGVFTRLTGDILEISVFMQTNDSNDAPPIVGTSYGPGRVRAGVGFNASFMADCLTANPPYSSTVLMGYPSYFILKKKCIKDFD